MDRETLRSLINESADKMQTKLEEMGLFEDMRSEAQNRIKNNQESAATELFNLPIDMSVAISSSILLEVLNRLFEKGILVDHSKSDSIG